MPETSSPSSQASTPIPLWHTLHFLSLCNWQRWQHNTVCHTVYRLFLGHQHHCSSTKRTACSHAGSHLKQGDCTSREMGAVAQPKQPSHTGLGARRSHQQLPNTCRSQRSCFKPRPAGAGSRRTITAAAPHKPCCTTICFQQPNTQSKEVHQSHTELQTSCSNLLLEGGA